MKKINRDDSIPQMPTGNMGLHKRIIKYYKSETKGMNINEI